MAWFGFWVFMSVWVIVDAWIRVTETADGVLFPNHYQCSIDDEVENG